MINKGTPVALFVFSNDVDSFLSQIENEKKQIQQALEAFHETNRLQVVMHTFTDSAELMRLFQRYAGRIALFHFSGHASSEGLQLNQGITSTDFIYAEGIAGFLAKEVKTGKLKFVFLNGCSTAPQVAALKAAGVPNIIATNYPISDRKATDFSAFFYRTMANVAKAKPFAETPVTIAQALDATKNYLNSAYQTKTIENDHRGFVFQTPEIKEQWTFVADEPNWYLPNKRNRNLLMIALFVLFPLLGYGVYAYKVSVTPLDMTISMDDKTPNPELPPLAATLSMTYNGKTETFENVADATTFKNLFRSGEEVQLSFRANGFVPKDTVFQLTKGLVLPVWRDATYAVLKGKITDEDGSPLSEVQITVQGQTVETDKAGLFLLQLAPSKQRPNQRLDIFKAGFAPQSIETPIVANEEVRLVLIKK
jgi:hypothetical protein